MIPRLRWALTKALFATAAAGMLLAGYGQAMPRFLG